MRYQKATVLWTYHYDKPGRYEPTLEQLEEWDETLWEFYEPHLVPQMTAANITPINKATKSRIVALAEVSYGSGNARARVRNACRFYVNTWDLF